MSENIKIIGIALNINDKAIYITLDEARELSKQLSEFLNKKDDKEDKMETNYKLCYELLKIIEDLAKKIEKNSNTLDEINEYGKYIRIDSGIYADMIYDKIEK